MYSENKSTNQLSDDCKDDPHMQKAGFLMTQLISPLFIQHCEYIIYIIFHGLILTHVKLTVTSLSYLTEIVIKV